MIHVDRAQVDRPQSLASDEAKRASAEAKRFFSQAPTKRAQRSFQFDASVYAAKNVVDALARLFASKCAYCETRLARADIVVDHFRPSSDALDLRGGLSPDHYWWLAYEWADLYPACKECSSAKGSRFPVVGERAPVGSRGKDLERENDLLLDPCRDQPEGQLVFLDDGSVASSARAGRTTIETLGLNRGRLIEDRSMALGRARAEWGIALAGLTDPTQTPSSQQLEAMFDPSRQFAALRRQFVNQWAHEQRVAVERVLAKSEEGPSSLAEVSGDLNVVTKATKRDVKRDWDTTQRAQEEYSVTEAQANEAYYSRTRAIERVEIKNFKVLKELTLEIPPAPTEERSGWLMLLGENGTGKSTVLQAIALALAGQEYRDRLGLNATGYVRHRARKGYVRVHLSGVSEPISLEFSRDSSRFAGSPHEPKVLLLGYGSTRLLPRATFSAPPESLFARIDNLFNPFIPLADATSWLLDLPDAAFDTVAGSLKKMLPVEDSVTLIKNPSEHRIDASSYGTRVSLEELSDGYQSVVALAVDVMAVMLSRWPTMDAAEGIVLVDELGAHLHPRWRMRITEALRNVFPRIQFLVSTHDPLCLRGLGDGEVTVLRRDEKGEIDQLTDLPSVAGLRVDQLLTSEFFGLNSTVDPELDELFAEYYLLKAKPRLTQKDEHRHSELKAALEKRQVLGTTRRERIVLEAADDFLAQAGSIADPDQRHQLKQSTKRQIAAIWEQAGQEVDAP